MTNNWQSTLAHLTLENGGGTVYPDTTHEKTPIYDAQRHAIGHYFVAICETCGAAAPTIAREYKSLIRHWYATLPHDHPGALVGSWINDGRLYLDIVLPISNLGDALTLARATNQLAIYDAIKGESINV